MIYLISGFIHLNNITLLSQFQRFIANKKGNTLFASLERSGQPQILHDFNFSSRLSQIKNNEIISGLVFLYILLILINPIISLWNSMYNIVQQNMYESKGASMCVLT